MNMTLVGTKSELRKAQQDLSEARRVIATLRTSIDLKDQEIANLKRGIRYISSH